MGPGAQAQLDSNSGSSSKNILNAHSILSFVYFIMVWFKVFVNYFVYN